MDAADGEVKATLRRLGDGRRALLLHLLTEGECEAQLGLVDDQVNQLAKLNVLVNTACFNKRTQN